MLRNIMKRGNHTQMRPLNEKIVVDDKCLEKNWIWTTTKSDITLSKFLKVYVCWKAVTWIKNILRKKWVKIRTLKYILWWKNTRKCEIAIVDESHVSTSHVDIKVNCKL